VKSIDFRQEFEQKIAAKKALQEIQNKLNSADAQRSVSKTGGKTIPTAHQHFAVFCQLVNSIPNFWVEKRYGFN
jgi:hypothetical protein